MTSREPSTAAPHAAFVRRSLTTVLAALSFLLLSAEPSRAQCPRKGTTHEQILRSRAVKTAMPVFPAEAVKAKAQGVAVARLSVGKQGEVESVEVIQAAHPLVGKALSDAASRWAFKPFEIGGQPACVQAKLTFYFEIDKDGSGIVRNPKVYTQAANRKP